MTKWRGWALRPTAADQPARGTAVPRMIASCTRTCGSTHSLDRPDDSFAAPRYIAQVLLERLGDRAGPTLRYGGSEQCVCQDLLMLHCI